MKEIIVLACLAFVVACTPTAAPETPSVDNENKPDFANFVGKWTSRDLPHPMIIDQLGYVTLTNVDEPQFKGGRSEVPGTLDHAGKSFRASVPMIFVENESQPIEISVLIEMVIVDDKTATGTIARVLLGKTDSKATTFVRE